jgi:nucleotide-binding universal stress UspA family protein
LIKGANSHLAATKPSHAFIAWDSSKHAAVAVHNALPLLSLTDEVTVAVFDPVRNEGVDGEEPGADLASWLSRRGCKVNVEQYPSGGEEIATCIMKRAAEKGADLIVMGGYGHMKLKQQIFGGTTESMLQQRKVPVLIGHK